MLFPGLSIQEAGPAHINELRSICVQTFSGTYERLNTPENFQKYIDEHFSVAELKTEVESNDSKNFLIYSGEELAGYLKLNHGESQTEKIKGDCIEIERIYVLKKYHGQKIGDALLQLAITKALELGKKFIWLGVWEKNERAIQFYKKHGFVQFDTHIFKLGDDDQNDYLFKLEL